MPRHFLEHNKVEMRSGKTFNCETFRASDFEENATLRRQFRIEMPPHFKWRETLSVRSRSSRIFRPFSGGIPRAPAILESSAGLH
jgi:hypothetical protein